MGSPIENSHEFENEFKGNHIKDKMGSPITDSPRNKRDKRFWATAAGIVIVVVIILILIFIIILLATALASSDDEDEEEQPSLQTLQDELMSALNGEMSNSTWFPISSPQKEALNWMMNEDEGFDIETTPPNIILERYVVAVLYYATDGPNWEYHRHFLSDLPVCEWSDAYPSQTGVSCNDCGTVTRLDLGE
jgi:type II secretory pathway pseudopilin PulG